MVTIKNQRKYDTRKAVHDAVRTLGMHVLTYDVMELDDQYTAHFLVRTSEDKHYVERKGFSASKRDQI